MEKIKFKRNIDANVLKLWVVVVVVVVVVVTVVVNFYDSSVVLLVLSLCVNNACIIEAFQCVK